MAKKVLSASFLEEIRTLLVNELARIEKELANFSHRDPEKAENAMSDAGADEGESAERIAQLGDDLSLEEELNKAVKDVEGALKALEKGEYGMCKYCKQSIDEARLRIRPTSTSCVACKRTLTQEM
jgi:DnaK suppressor protein